MKNFDTFAVMIDCSRNAAPTVGSLKKFFSVISRMGYNAVLLYMEDMYDIENEKYFGYKRGKYSAIELRELDEYASSVGIELIPCIQTLAHLGRIFHWREYWNIKDIDDVLLVDDERTYELIDNMFSSISKCIKSRRIHIGMDEAIHLGQGKYLDVHGQSDRYELFVRHLSRVCEIAEKYGYKPMMWEDMFFVLAVGQYHFIEKEIDFPESVKQKVPKNCSLVWWDYFSNREEQSRAMLLSSKKLSDDVWFSGSAWICCDFIPQLRFSEERNRIALSNCIKYGIKNAIITLWGDDGGECPIFSALPALMDASAVARGISEAQKYREFKEITDVDFCVFSDIELPNYVYGENEPFYRGNQNRNPPNYSKNRLYNDPFLAFVSTNTKEVDGKIFSEYAKRLYKDAENAGEFSYIFKCAANLCRALEIKFSLPERTREFYDKGDKAALKSLAENEYTELVNRLEIFYESFKYQWEQVNKPYGFEVHDIRIGGLIRRTEHCRERLLDYACGKTEHIEELEEGLLMMKDGYIPAWSDMVTAGAL